MIRGCAKSSIPVAYKCWQCKATLTLYAGVTTICGNCDCSMVLLSDSDGVPPLADSYKWDGLAGKSIMVPLIDHAVQHVPCP